MKQVIALIAFAFTINAQAICGAIFTPKQDLSLHLSNLKSVSYAQSSICKEDIANYLKEKAPVGPKLLVGTTLINDVSPAFVDRLEEALIHFKIQGIDRAELERSLASDNNTLGRGRSVQSAREFYEAFQAECPGLIE